MNIVYFAINIHILYYFDYYICILCICEDYFLSCIKLNRDKFEKGRHFGYGIVFGIAKECPGRSRYGSIITPNIFECGY